MGPLGDTDRAQEMLDGTFTYPQDTDLWTIKFFEEAQHTFAMLGGETINTDISVYVSKVFGNMPTRRNHPHSVVGTTACTRRLVMINIFLPFTLQN